MSSSLFLDVSLESVHLDRGERRVLTDVNWRIRPGERWVVLGGNGAGKTQLLKLLNGEVWPAPEPQGRRIWRWRGRSHRTPVEVREEIAYVGPERQDRYERYDQDFTVRAVVGTGLHRSDIPQAPLRPAEQRRVHELLKRLGIRRLAGRRLLSLSYGERRLVLLARALATRPRLLLLDEAANGLDVRNRARLERWLDSTRRSRLPWVYTTHRAEDVPASANRLLVLQQGRITWCGDMDRDALASQLAHVPAARPTAGKKTRRSAAATPLIELVGADVHAEAVPLLRGIDLAVRPGECWMVHGGNGSGKTTLLRTLYGDFPVATPGIVRRLGRIRTPLADFRARASLVAPHLHAQHLQEERVLDIVVSGLHASIGLNDVATAQERRRALQTLRELGLEALQDRTVRELSYGQMRRVLFARAFVNRPRLLLLDEPFAGVDSHTRAALLEAIESQAVLGTAIVMASHHRSEWPRCATHELELRAGRVVHGGELRA